VTEEQYNLKVCGKITAAQKAQAMDDFELAGAAKCSANEIAAYRKGRMPKPFRLAMIAKALNVPLDDLAGIG
jgi:transcriptional regulator with XRE-family HTH domain